MKYDIYVFEEKKTASFLKKAMAEYEKRLSRYCKITCRFIRKQNEWEKILKNNPDSIAILPGKDSVSSEMFSEQINCWETGGMGKRVFLVPPEGEKGMRQNVFPLSDFTMENGLTALILLEQIYRGYRILHNHPYHK
ncbi:MAG: 23S rRNA (pseudouridine(1915)-N(3))-methyltransferase RlmH [Eubacterium sp.]|nr:23S rRNA (pseudouridine(1915)-N(3))-methyltransferase RlmH [Eubacterium sp.]